MIRESSNHERKSRSLSVLRRSLSSDVHSSGPPAVLFSFARSPYNFSLRGLPSGHAVLVGASSTARGQCWSKCSVVIEALVTGTRLLVMQYLPGHRAEGSTGTSVLLSLGHCYRDTTSGHAVLAGPSSRGQCWSKSSVVIGALVTETRLPGHAVLVGLSSRGQSWSKSSVVTGALLKGHGCWPCCTRWTIE